MQNNAQEQNNPKSGDLASSANLVGQNDGQNNYVQSHENIQAQINVPVQGYNQTENLEKMSAEQLDGSKSNMQKNENLQRRSNQFDNLEANITFFEPQSNSNTQGFQTHASNTLQNENGNNSHQKILENEKKNIEIQNQQALKESNENESKHYQKAQKFKEKLVSTNLDQNSKNAQDFKKKLKLVKTQDNSEEDFSSSSSNLKTPSSQSGESDQGNGEVEQSGIHDPRSPGPQYQNNQQNLFPFPNQFENEYQRDENMENNDDDDNVNGQNIIEFRNSKEKEIDQNVFEEEQNKEKKSKDQKQIIRKNWSKFRKTYQNENIKEEEFLPYLLIKELIEILPDFDNKVALIFAGSLDQKKYDETLPNKLLQKEILIPEVEEWLRQREQDYEDLAYLEGSPDPLSSSSNLFEKSRSIPKALENFLKNSLNKHWGMIQDLEHELEEEKKRRIDKLPPFNGKYHLLRFGRKKLTENDEKTLNYLKGFRLRSFDPAGDGVSNKILHQVTEDLKVLTEHYVEAILQSKASFNVQDIQMRWRRTCVGVLKKEELILESCDSENSDTDNEIDEKKMKKADEYENQKKIKQKPKQKIQKNNQRENIENAQNQIIENQNQRGNDILILDPLNIISQDKNLSELESRVLKQIQALFKNYYQASALDIDVQRDFLEYNKVIADQRLKKMSQIDKLSMLQDIGNQYNSSNPTPFYWLTETQNLLNRLGKIKDKKNKEISTLLSKFKSSAFFGKSQINNKKISNIDQQIENIEQILEQEENHIERDEVKDQLDNLYQDGRLHLLISEQKLKRILPKAEHFVQFRSAEVLNSNNQYVERVYANLRIEMLKIWKSCGDKGSQANCVVSYGYEHPSIPNKYFQVLNVVLSLRNFKTTQNRGTGGEQRRGNLVFEDSSKKLLELALIQDLIVDEEKQRNYAKASIASLFSVKLTSLIRTHKLTCQTIGLKFVRPDIENHHKRGPRYFNYHGFQNFCKQLKYVFIEGKKLKDSGKQEEHFDEREKQLNFAYKQLQKLGITPDTQPYVFGCDIKDPIHFSATPQDMRIISFQDSYNKWINQESPQNNQLFKTRKLDKQADLPVATIELFEDKFPDKGKPIIRVLKSNEDNSIFKVSNTLDEKKQLEAFIRNAIEKSKKILEKIESGEELGLDPPPPAVNLHKPNFYQDGTNTTEMEHHYEGKIKSDLTGIIKNEHLQPEVIQGERSFSNLFSDLETAQQLKAFKGYTDKRKEVWSVEYLKKYVGTNKYQHLFDTQAGEFVKELVQRNYYSKQKKNSELKANAELRINGYIKYDDVRDARNERNYDENPQQFKVSKKKYNNDDKNKKSVQRLMYTGVMGAGSAGNLRALNTLNRLSQASRLTGAQSFQSQSAKSSKSKKYKVKFDDDGQEIPRTHSISFRSEYGSEISEQQVEKEEEQNGIQNEIKTEKKKGNQNQFSQQIKKEIIQQNGEGENVNNQIIQPSDPKTQIQSKNLQRGQNSNRKKGQDNEQMEKLKESVSQAKKFLQRSLKNNCVQAENPGNIKLADSKERYETYKNFLQSSLNGVADGYQYVCADVVGDNNELIFDSIVYPGPSSKKQKAKNESEFYIDYFEIHRMKVVRKNLIKNDEEILAEAQKKTSKTKKNKNVKENTKASKVQKGLVKIKQLNYQDDQREDSYNNKTVSKSASESKKDDSLDKLQFNQSIGTKEELSSQPIEGEYKLVIEVYKAKLKDAQSEEEVKKLRNKIKKMKERKRELKKAAKSKEKHEADKNQKK